ncbi:fimbria/pilus outer membrane usher protein [Enterobacter bugandensis]|uniref:fimbria/pilus outer membrane usher protein n=1 Tax=Enterobacter bugandensis TaxID=881260 RepID=UPI0021CF294F|nr:fimbria/pilus outer membrane usher protein [Enterobacter bugandensis]
MMQVNNKIVKLRPRWLAFFVSAQIAILTAGTDSAHARDYFNPALLELGAPSDQPVDLSAFEIQGGQIPGNYLVDIYINDKKMETRDVEFRSKKDTNGKETLLPCLPVEILKGWGVKTESFPELGVPDSECANILLIPQASSDFRFSRQQLLLSFPQSALNNSARGWIDPTAWEQGIHAFLLNYSATASNNYAKIGHGKDISSQYINLRPGINFGPWRLRNYTTWSRSNGNSQNDKNEGNWDTIYTYLQRDIIALKSKLKVGDSTTPSDIFDSISYRGMELGSDDDMLPESLKGYAPIVRGIARTNAKVTIRQNGYVIYESYVSPGAFEITDMYPTGGSGDLNMTITETDGTVQHQTIPFASVPVLQREGRFKYNITGGVYRSYDAGVEETPLGQLTAIYGLPKGFTIYGGSQLSRYYHSIALGVGKNLGSLGAVSTDVTNSWSTMKDREKESGQSLRMRYSKNFAETGTNFAIAGYRYATNGYWGMQEVLQSYSNNDYMLTERRRNRAELTISQRLWEQGGSIVLNAVREDYYDSSKKIESFSLGYFNSWNSINYSLDYTYNRNLYGSRTESQHGEKDQILSVNVSVPFSIFGGRDTSVFASYTHNSSKNGGSVNNVSLTGTALEQNNLSWGVNEGYGTDGQGNSGGANVNLRSTYGEINAGYSHDSKSQRLNYGVSGGIVVHEDGITFGQQLGDTIAIVSAPDASGVAVQRQPGVKTDYRGFAILPYATPYRKNEITLDTSSFDDTTEVAVTTQTVVPTRGAVVRANFNTSIGSRVLMTLVRADGKQAPFGSIVTTRKGDNNSSFIVGEDGIVYLTGLEQRGRLLVKWGADKSEQCNVDYDLKGNPSGLVNYTGFCS